MKEQMMNLAELARELRVAERDQVALGHILKARARDYVGHDALCSGDGEKLDQKKCTALYKRLIIDEKDPVFTNRVCRLADPWKMCAEEQNRLKRAMGAVVRKMPIWTEWAVNVRGIADSGLGKVLGQCPGNEFDGPGDFANPGKLWKWFGLHVEDGKAPRPTKGKKLGFSTYRAGVAYIVGEGLLKQGVRDEKDADGNKTGIKKAISPFGALYMDRKVYEVDAAHAKGLEILPSAKIKKGGEEGKISEGHIHKKALRYTTKRFFRELWQHWRKA